MIITWNRSNDFLTLDGREIRCWSKVRNELNGRRPVKTANSDHPDVFVSTNHDWSAGKPAMPRPCPSGEWKVKYIKNHPDPKENSGYLYPFFIMLDAHQGLPVWDLDEHGMYLKPSGEFVEDFGYGLHFSSSATTVGCVRIGSEADVRWMVGKIRPELALGEEVKVIIS